MADQESNLPAILTKDIRDQITELVKEGLDMENNKEEIAERLEIPLDHLKKLFRDERQELLLRKAELTSKELLEIDLNMPNLESKYGRAKINLLKLKQAEAQFIRESLGKDVGYSKRTEVTGKNGEEIRIKEIIFNAPLMPGKKND